MAEMAAEFAVSRRTMLRDLQALSEMGVPLAATPGPGGGYRLIADRRLLPLSLSPEEAIGVILSYESFLEYADSPFASQSLAAVTKLRNALPPDVVRELDEVHDHVVVLQQTPRYRAPFLTDVLRAALARVHLEIEYESVSGAAERLIFPYGLYAWQGFWYCACYDYRRETGLSLRVDRILRLDRKEDLEPPQSLTVRQWLTRYRTEAADTFRLRARVTPRGARRFELSALFGMGAVSPAGLLEVDLPRSEMGWFAGQLLPLGTDITVESPPELIDAILRETQAVAQAYAPGVRE